MSKIPPNFSDTWKSKTLLLTVKVPFLVLSIEIIESRMYLFLI